MHANKHWYVPGYPLPREICVSYIMTMVSGSISKIPPSFSTEPTASALGRQDDEDQAYRMDDDGNVEPSRSPTESPEAAGKNCCADGWGGSSQDDQELMESLEDFEEYGEEISDQLLLQCAAEFDSQ